MTIFRVNEAYVTTTTENVKYDDLFKEHWRLTVSMQDMSLTVPVYVCRCDVIVIG